MCVCLNMAKIIKSQLKAVQNRNRVNLHRRVRAIVENENQSMNEITGNQNQSFNQDNSNHERQEHENIALNERLRRWALQYNISKRAVTELLKILVALGITWLPKDSRALLSTPRHIEMQNLTNGKLWYSVFSVITFY